MIWVGSGMFCLAGAIAGFAVGRYMYFRKGRKPNANSSQDWRLPGK
jgi:hypothetical protein